MLGEGNGERKPANPTTADNTRNEFKYVYICE